MTAKTKKIKTEIKEGKGDKKSEVVITKEVGPSASHSKSKSNAPDPVKTRYLISFSFLLLLIPLVPNKH